MSVLYRNADIQKRIFMDELKKLNYIFDHKQKVESIGILIMIVIGSGLELLGVSAIQPFINVIIQPQQLLEKSPYREIYEFFHFTNTMQLVMLIILFLIAVYVVKNVYLIFMYRAQYRYIYSNMRRLCTKMMRCYLDQPYSFHTEKNSSELLRNINQDTADFFGTIQALVQLCTEGITVFVLILYLLHTDVTITLVMGAILGILIFGILRVFKKKLVVMGDRNRYYEAQVTKWVQQAFGGIKEVKVMNKEDFFFQEYDNAYAGRVKSEYTYHTMINIPKPVIEACSISALLGAIAVKLMSGTDTVSFMSTVSVFTVAAIRLLPSFNRIAEYLGTISYQKPAVTAIYHDLKEIDELNAERKKQQEKNKPAEQIKLKDAIHIQDVTFHYPKSEQIILNHVSFDIPKNTSVAFIGQSGAGKTTMADLILGVLVPNSGRILADDKDIQYNLNGWHRTIGYIPQNIYLMDDSIANNIAFGIPKDQIDPKRLRRAAERAQLADYIDSLPEGMETQVGERGVRLSGGQRQRIGIARALYNEPEVLILDEATSALDNETERAVMESIDALHGEMTLIIIAHRLSTIQNCDVAYRIGGGCVQRENEVPKG